MGAINSLLKRWGFVRLDEFGLILTSTDRIMTTRPAILDDGIGGRVVGWRADDLAVLELEPWQPAGSVPQGIAPPLVIVPPPTPPPPGATSSPRVPTPIRAEPTAVPDVTARAEPTAVPEVTARAEAVPDVTAPIRAEAIAGPDVTARTEPPPTEGEEWDWEIAIARARAAAEWIEETAAAAPALVEPPPAASPSSDEPLAASDVRQAPPSAPMPPPALPGAFGPFATNWSDAKPASTTRTVIPVPQLPIASHPQLVHLAPVTRPKPATPAELARGPFAGRGVAVRR